MEQPSPSAVAARKMFSITHQIVENGFSLDTDPLDRLEIHLFLQELPNRPSLADRFIQLHLQIRPFLMDQPGQILRESPGQVDQLCLFLRREQGHGRVLRPGDVAHHGFAAGPSGVGHPDALVPLVLRRLGNGYIALGQKILDDQIDRLFGLKRPLADLISFCVMPPLWKTAS